MIDIPVFQNIPAQMPIPEQMPMEPPVPNQMPAPVPQIPIAPILPPVLNVPVLPEKPKKQDPKKWTPEQVQKAQALYPQETAEKQQRMKTAAIAATPPTAKGTSGAWGKPV